MSPLPDTRSPRSESNITLAQISVEQAWEDPKAVTRNTDKILNRYLSVADSTDLVVFPELSLTGYIPLKGYDQRRKRLLAEVAQRSIEDELPRLLSATQDRRAALVVGTMEPSVMRNEIYNSVLYIELGATLGLYRKIHLPVEENHYFVPGTEVVVIDSSVGRVALSVCYDMMFPEVSRLAALRGAEMLLVPSNWLDMANLRRTGEVLPVARAIEGQMHVVFVNGVGDLSVRGRSWPLFGRSCMVSATGEVVVTCGPDEELLTAKLTRADLEAASDVFPVLRDRRPELYGELTTPMTRFGRWTSEPR